jgi:hypothetical protein
MSYYAQIVNDLVTNVIVVSNDIADGAQFAHDLLGGNGLKHLLTLQAKTMLVLATHTTQ